jgi:hypothetical protein
MRVSWRRSNCSRHRVGLNAVIGAEAQCTFSVLSEFGFTPRSAAEIGLAHVRIVDELASAALERERA